MALFLRRGLGEKEDVDAWSYLFRQFLELLAIHPLKGLRGQYDVNIVLLQDVDGLKGQRG